MTNRPFLKFCAIPLTIAGLSAMAIPGKPAAAFTEFQICAAQLIRFARVAPEDAAVACGEALLPKDLSRCVVTISQLTPTLKGEALVACRRVRRPVELGRCVFDISEGTRNSEPLAVLDHCRRSLLPLRFSECVTGLSREVDFAPPKAMETCIAAEDFPRNLSPTVAPPPSSNPTLPTFVPNVIPGQVIPIQPEVPRNPVNPQ
jgi:hypothetical protein